MNSKRLSIPDTHAFTFDLQPELTAIDPDIQGLAKDRHFSAPAGELVLNRNLPMRQPELGRYPDDLLGNIHGALLLPNSGIHQHSVLGLRVEGNR